MRTTRCIAHTRVSFLPLRAEARAHEVETHRAVARRLAALLECEFVPDARASPEGAPGYVIPDDTFTSLTAARAFAVEGEHDLFGGVVPWPYMAGKTISHPLHDAWATAPAGWCADFPLLVKNVVLPGYSAFSKDDAAVAARSLLREGSVRIKLASGIGGSGQTVVHDERSLSSALAALDGEDARKGLVTERNLEGVRTFSVGRICVGTLQASYVGEQHKTRNHAGTEVYGGSELMFARGDFQALAPFVDDEYMRRAVDLASVYHRAAILSLSGMFASRCNYDVACGTDSQGVRRMGVLEQSWRIGGASGAEVAALEAFASDASLRTVRASTVEVYASVDPPEGVTVYFQGSDPSLGPITKYALLQHDALPRRTD